MLTSLVYLQQGKVEKSNNMMKIVNIDEESLYILQRTWGFLMIFLGKMCLMMILKVTKTKALRSL